MATGTDPSRRAHSRGTLLRIYAPLGLFAVGAVWFLLGTQPPATLRTLEGITELSPPLALPGFSLETGRGESLTTSSLKGRWTLLTLGFTSCPDICPATLNVLSRAVQGSDAPAGAVQVLFVSVDPERDTPKRLHAYAKHFGAFVTGATGSHKQLRALTEPLGLFYERDAEAADDETYSVQHSTTVLLVDPGGQVVALLRGGALTADEISAALDGFRRRA
jgi:protein SCO1/2